MNRREFQIGPGAASLLLIAVVLCMGVLGALSLVSARGDARLSERSMRMAESTARLNADSEEHFAQLDAALSAASDAASEEEYLSRVAQNLPEGAELNERTVSWVESSEDGRRVSCAVEIAPLGEFPRAHWTEHRVWTELNEGNPEDEPLFDDLGALGIPSSGQGGALEIDLS